MKQRTSHRFRFGRYPWRNRWAKARLADQPTLLAAISEWLYRTPIQGSMPGSPDDDARVRGFIEAYCAAHARSARAARELARFTSLSDADAARLDARYEKEIEGARAFLLAEDVAAPERARRSRVRAALVFIESYRELPLLAWPRAVIDALVAFEQAFVLFRQRHARMVRARDRPPHRHRRLGRGRLPRPDRATLPHLDHFMKSLEKAVVPNASWTRSMTSAIERQTLCSARTIASG